MEEAPVVIAPEVAAQPQATALPSVNVDSVGAINDKGLFIPHRNNLATTTEVSQPATTTVAPEQTTTTTVQTGSEALQAPRFLDESINQAIKTEQEQTPYYKRMGAKVGKEFQTEQEFEQHFSDLHSQNATLQQTSIQDEGLQLLNHVVRNAPVGKGTEAAKYVLDLLSADWNVRDAQGAYQIPDDHVIKAYYRERGQDVESDEFLADLEGLTSFQKMTTAEPLRKELQNGINQEVHKLKEQAKANAPKYSQEVIQRQGEWQSWVDGYAEYAKTAPNTINGIPVSGLDVLRTKYILEQLKSGKIFDSILKNPQTKKLDYAKLELAVMTLSSDLHPEDQQNFMQNLNKRLQPQQRAQLEKETMEKMMNLPSSKPQTTRHSQANTTRVSELSPQLQKLYKL